MPSSPSSAVKARYCSECGTQLEPGARFCHGCGVAIGAGTAPKATSRSAAGLGDTLKWAVPTAAFLALLVITAFQFSTQTPVEQGGTMPGGGGAVPAPDLSSMAPEEQANRLFNRVMRLAAEGRMDSVAFFGPMALSALQALSPLDPHRRYDIGLVAMVTGASDVAKAQADTILRQRPTHLLGLVLAARAAAARGDARASADYRRRLIAAESAERKRGDQEYTDHDPDIRAVIAAPPET